MALEICTDKGMVICSKNDLAKPSGDPGSCCNTGCQYDHEWVWVSDQGMYIDENKKVCKEYFCV